MTKEQQKEVEEKTKLQLIDPYFIEGLGKVLTYGAKKYQTGAGWKTMEGENGEDPIFLTKGSVMRHWNEYMKGNFIDDGPKGSGLPHLWHCASQLMILCQLEREKQLEEAKKEKVK